METVRRYLRVDRRKIAFLRFILEGYDGIALMETLDAKKGAVVLYIAPGCEPDVDFVVNEMRRQVLIEDMESAPGRSRGPSGSTGHEAV